MSDLVGCRGWGGWLRDVEKPRSGFLEAAKWNCDSWGSVETLGVAVASPESSMFAILSPPKAWERLRSPFMTIVVFWSVGAGDTNNGPRKKAQRAQVRG